MADTETENPQDRAPAIQKPTPTYKEGSEARSSAISPSNTPGAKPADFNETFTTNQRGDRFSTGSRPQKDVRDIMSKAAGGQRLSNREKTRMNRWSGTTSGKNFDWGSFRSSLAKVRRESMGQGESIRQLDEFNKQGTPQGAETETEVPEQAPAQDETAGIAALATSAQDDSQGEISPDPIVADPITAPDSSVDTDDSTNIVLSILDPTTASLYP